jgi:transposase
VTALDSLLAVTAAEHLGLTPRCAHRESTSFHVDGRDHSDAEPVAQVVHITRGDSRAHRPDLNHVMWERMVEHQACIPLLLTPRSGHSRDAHDCGDVVGASVPPLPTTYGTTSLVADRALYHADTLHKLAQTRMRGITRVPATLSAAQAALAQVAPHALASLTPGDRDGEWRSTDGGIEPRWLLLSSESRPPQAQRTIDQPWGQHSANEVKAFQT